MSRNEGDGRLVAAYSTKTAVSITTSTTTVPLTCYLNINTAVCKKRRFRTKKNFDVAFHHADDE
ncbi:hypothetical protein SK128_003825 [Halocaridina rubra]|uniref:Uncharacterized protein n=1 Tax=Halocaridina rubra TaxID=373956 RepID=A0AAN8XCC9_HALRR